MPIRRQYMPKSAVQDVLMSTTFLSLGAGLFTFFWRAPIQFQNDYGWVGIPIWFGSGACIGLACSSHFVGRGWGLYWALACKSPISFRSFCGSALTFLEGRLTETLRSATKTPAGWRGKGELPGHAAPIWC
jgi:hypothetical protein